MLLCRFPVHQLPTEKRAPPHRRPSFRLNRLENIPRRRRRRRRNHLCQVQLTKVREVRRAQTFRRLPTGERPCVSCDHRTICDHSPWRSLFSNNGQKSPPVSLRCANLSTRVNARNGRASAFGLNFQPWPTNDESNILTHDEHST